MVDASLYIMIPPSVFSSAEIHVNDNGSNHMIKLTSSSRKRVRFDEGQNHAVSSNDGEELMACKWLESGQLRQMHFRNRTLAAAIRRNVPEYADSILYLMKSSKDAGKPNEARREELRQHITRIMHTDCRGLERHIVPMVTLCRRRNLRSVLTFQRELKEKGLFGTSVGDNLLREKSLCTSLPLRQLAYRLGQTDEWEANNLKQSSNQPTDLVNRS